MFRGDSVTPQRSQSAKSLNKTTSYLTKSVHRAVWFGFVNLRFEEPAATRSCVPASRLHAGLFPGWVILKLCPRLLIVNTGVLVSGASDQTNSVFVRRDGISPRTGFPYNRWSQRRQSTLSIQFGALVREARSFACGRFEKREAIPARNPAPNARASCSGFLTVLSTASATSSIVRRN
jgi:hypothetical protein